MITTCQKASFFSPLPENGISILARSMTCGWQLWGTQKRNCKMLCARQTVSVIWWSLPPLQKSSILDLYKTALIVKKAQVRRAQSRKEKTKPFLTSFRQQLINFLQVVLRAIAWVNLENSSTVANQDWQRRCCHLMGEIWESQMRKSSGNINRYCVTVDKRR